MFEYVVTCLCVLFMMNRVLLYGLCVFVFVCSIVCLLKMRFADTIVNYCVLMCEFV